MINIFNNHVADFNAKFTAKNYAAAVPVANLIIKIADEQCAKPELRADMRERYVLCATRAREFLNNYNAGKYNSVNTAGSNNGGDEGTPSGTQWFSAEVPKLKLNDIAGLKKVKEEFIINIFAPFFPQTAKIYKKYRSDVGLQVLLYGPPGTGKTFAVKCLAGQLGCKIAVVQVKDVMSKYVGEGAKVISEVFEQAKNLDKCIIFFDEIDSIATSRDDDESRHTKEQFTQLLTNMDGFMAGTKPGQLRIIIAATNRPWALDSALLRGGRFETKIYMPLPDHEARKKLISDALGLGPNAKFTVPVAPELTLDILADKFDGYSGADIKAACRQMANLPMKREILYYSNPENTAPLNDCITLEDCELVLKDYIISTSDEELFRYDAYAAGKESVDEYKNELEPIAREQIKKGIPVPPHVRRFINSCDEADAMLASMEADAAADAEESKDSLEADVRALIELIEKIKHRLK